MRRPLKPFVTEYKGSRRAAPSFGEAAPFDNERPAPKPAEPQARPEADDSYEAAMRAADALFAAPGSRGVEERSSSQPRVESARADGEPTNPERYGGRILRVIDEAPPPQYAAREAEFAPKRRGRKPGSKNKPKLVPPSIDSESQAVVPESSTASLPTRPPCVPQHVTLQHPATRPVTMPAQRQVVALSAATGASRGDRRYAWLRDRLKPGEDWKRRRLPRVCW